MDWNPRQRRAAGYLRQTPYCCSGCGNIVSNYPHQPSCAIHEWDVHRSAICPQYKDRREEKKG